MPEKEGAGMCVEGSGGTGSLALRVFICFLKAGILGKVSGEDLNRIFTSLPGVPSRIMVSTDWSELGQGVIGHCSWP